MSLLNQVLRDLDHRHASGTPAAVKASISRPAPARAGHRAVRWGLGIAATVVAIIAGGWAQGSIRWPARTEMRAASPVAVAAPASATPVVIVVPAAPVITASAPAVVQPPAAPRAAMPQAAATAAVTAATPPTAPASARRRPPVVSATRESTAPVTTAAARIELSASARLPQERAEAHYQRGVAAHQAGQINDSSVAFTAALREEPRFHPARQAQAGVLIGQARMEEAEALLQEGLALSPGHPTLALMLARLQADRQDLPAALSTLQSAQPQAAQNADFQGVHAALLQRIGKHAEAAERFSAALRLSPGHSVWWMGLGISLAATGQPDTAREAFQRAKATGSLGPEAVQYVDTRLKQLL